MGIGGSMTSADMYVAWKNSTNGCTLSRRTANGYSAPTYSSTQSIVPLNVTATSGINIACSFLRPINESPALSSSSRYIYGSSNTGPSNVDDPTANFNRHSKYGGYSGVNYLQAFSGTSGSTTGTGTAGQSEGTSGGTIGDVGTAAVVSTENQSGTALIFSNPEQYNQMLIAHGSLMFLAWGVAPFFGIFVARYLKNVLGVWWYRLHLGLMFGITGVFTAISFILIVLYQPYHFKGVHSKIGLAVMIVTVLQIILGYVSNAMWTPDRKEISVWDKVHWWVGRSIFILAIANVYLGLDEYEEFAPLSKTIIIMYWIVIAAGFGLLGYGQFKYGQIRKFHLTF